MNISIALAVAFFISPLAAAKPAIVFSATDVAALTLPADTVRFTVVAASSGAELAGAVLTDPETGAAYGGFTADAEKGGFILETSLAQIFRVRPIEPAADGWESRVFRVSVFDEAGARESVDLSIDLHGASYAPLETSLFLDLPAEVRQVQEWNKRYSGGTEFEMSANLILFSRGGERSEIQVSDERDSRRRVANYADPTVGDRMYRWMVGNGFGKFISNDYTIKDFGLRCRFRAGTLTDCWRRTF
jgi:hypothetical protein